ncbi:hypothetical protein D3C84_876040 [compost metagenome]
MPEDIQGQRAQQRSGQQHLRQADAEHRFAHHPQAAWRQLKTDDEQQQHHAKFRDVRNAFRIADQAQARGADDHPGKQITQHRAQLQALGEGDGEHGREQEYDCGLQQTAFMGHEKNSINSVRRSTRIKAGLGSRLSRERGFARATPRRYNNSPRFQSRTSSAGAWSSGTFITIWSS